MDGRVEVASLWGSRATGTASDTDADRLRHVPDLRQRSSLSWSPADYRRRSWLYRLRLELRPAPGRYLRHGGSTYRPDRGRRPTRHVRDRLRRAIEGGRSGASHKVWMRTGPERSFRGAPGFPPGEAENRQSQHSSAGATQLGDVLSTVVADRPVSTAPSRLVTFVAALNSPYVFGLLLVIILLITLPYGLHNDIRYEIGVHAVSDQSAALTFSHRPLLYRLLLAALAWPGFLFSLGLESREVLLRVEAVILSLGAAMLLFFGLRRYDRYFALPSALVVLASIVLMSPGVTLEPEWLSLVLAVASGRGMSSQARVPLSS
jgi:hypothetical protein